MTHRDQTTEIKRLLLQDEGKKTEATSGEVDGQGLRLTGQARRMWADRSIHLNLVTLPQFLPSPIPRFPILPLQVVDGCSIRALSIYVIVE